VHKSSTRQRSFLSRLRNSFFNSPKPPPPNMPLDELIKALKDKQSELNLPDDTDIVIDVHECLRFTDSKDTKNNYIDPIDHI